MTTGGFPPASRTAACSSCSLSEYVTSQVDRVIRAERARHDPASLVGISCLADGADQIFARAVLDHGGALKVVIPAVAYRDGLPEDASPDYDELFNRATAVDRLDYYESTSEANMAASVHMLEDADLLFAVWDGKPARSYGGTADVVDHARRHGTPVTVIWPEGVVRD